MSSVIPAILRRFATGLFSDGPWRIKPFQAIVEDRLDESRGVHRAEDFTGVIAQATAETFLYQAAYPLLDQDATGERLANGPRYRSKGILPSRSKTLFSLCDAGIATGDGVVYCPRSRFAVSETVRCWTKPQLEHSVLCAPRFPAARHLPGCTLSLLTLSAEGFYHFLVEALPRLRLAGSLFSKVDHVLANGRAGSFQAQWLAQVGVPPEKMVWADGLTHFRCEQLLFCGSLIADCEPDGWLREAIRELCHAPRLASGNRWLWISREDAISRHLIWEDELLAHFPRFEKITLARRSPAEQVALFADAAVVAGPHGAGLANLLFAPPGVRLVEFFPHAKIAPLFARCAQIAGGCAAWAWTDFSKAVDLERLLPPLRKFLDIHGASVSAASKGIGAPHHVSSLA